MDNFDSLWRSVSLASSETETSVLPLQEEEEEEPDSDIEALKLRAKNIAKNSGTPINNITKSKGEQQLEFLLSNLLKYGVLIASLVVLFGGILYLVRHGDEPARYRIFRGEPSSFCHPLGVIRAAMSGSSRGIILAGLMLLVATPVLRVIISCLAFLRLQDFSYVVVTLSVLTALIYSLIK
jgi:uncharacterized membrane protein